MKREETEETPIQTEGRDELAVVYPWKEAEETSVITWTSKTC